MRPQRSCIYVKGAFRKYMWYVLKDVMQPTDFFYDLKTIFFAK